MVFIQLFLMLAVIYALALYVRLVIIMIPGLNAMRKAEGVPGNIICKNLLYNKKAYIFKIVSGLILLVVSSKLLASVKAAGVTWAVVIYVLLIILEVMQIFIYLVALIKDEKAYLTRDGIMACMGVMGRLDCTFAWEQNVGNQEPHVLLVYKKKMNSPYRFQFDSDCKHVYEIVDSFVEKEM